MRGFGLRGAVRRAAHGARRTARLRGARRRQSLIQTDGLRHTVRGGGGINVIFGIGDVIYNADITFRIGCFVIVSHETYVVPHLSSTAPGLGFGERRDVQQTRRYFKEWADHKTSQNARISPVHAAARAPATVHEILHTVKIASMPWQVAVEARSIRDQANLVYFSWDVSLLKVHSCISKKIARARC